MKKILISSKSSTWKICNTGYQDMSSEEKCIVSKVQMHDIVDYMWDTRHWQTCIQSQKALFTQPALTPFIFTLQQWQYPLEVTPALRNQGFINSVHNNHPTHTALCQQEGFLLQLWSSLCTLWYYAQWIGYVSDHLEIAFSTKELELLQHFCTLLWCKCLK